MALKKKKRKLKNSRKQTKRKTKTPPPPTPYSGERGEVSPSFPHSDRRQAGRRAWGDTCWGYLPACSAVLWWRWASPNLLSPLCPWLARHLSVPAFCLPAGTPVPLLCHLTGILPHPFSPDPKRHITTTCLHFLAHVTASLPSLQLGPRSTSL